MDERQALIEELLETLPSSPGMPVASLEAHATGSWSMPEEDQAPSA